MLSLTCNSYKQHLDAERSFSVICLYRQSDVFPLLLCNNAAVIPLNILFSSLSIFLPLFLILYFSPQGQFAPGDWVSLYSCCPSNIIQGITSGQGTWPCDLLAGSLATLQAYVRLGSCETHITMSHMVGLNRCSCIPCLHLKTILTLILVKWLQMSKSKNSSSPLSVPIVHLFWHQAPSDPPSISNYIISSSSFAFNSVDLSLWDSVHSHSIGLVCSSVASVVAETECGISLRYRDRFTFSVLQSTAPAATWSFLLAGEKQFKFWFCCFICCTEITSVHLKCH